MKACGGPKRSQWEDVIQKGSIEGKEQLRTRRGTQDAQNGFNRQRKGKKSDFPKLSENDMTAKSASQYF
jgi:hypothetical protein